MARNIFNQPPKDTAAKTVAEPSSPQSPAPSLQKATQVPGSVGGLRESLREITANSIRDIDPSLIDADGLKDRLDLDDASLDALAESMRKHGQQVPIMVRPSQKSDRFRIVYGRRRLAAVRKLGGTIKAIVRTLDDDASMIAQGQENNLRLDPSFIEKALFIQEMQTAGFKPGVIQDALCLSRQGVSNHRVVIEQLPEGLVQLIGPAHGVGRRQWGDLAALAGKIDLIETAETVIGSLSRDTESAEKFKAVFVACSAAAKDTNRSSDKVQTFTLSNTSGVSLGSIRGDDKTVTVKISKKVHPEFALWFEEQADELVKQLFDQWSEQRNGP